MSHDSKTTNGFWQSEAFALVFVFLVLGITLLLPGVGVIVAFVIALMAALVGRRAGSFHDMGIRAPDSWPKLLGTTLAYGVVIQLGFTIFVEPLLERLTGSAVDISVLDPVRGNLLGSLFMIALGWVAGGFVEEFTFRGFVVTRVRELLGGGRAAVWAAVLAAAVPFGIAHMYQGPSGMIVTGLAGFLLGAIYVFHGFNLWYPVLAHGFINTIAMIMIYFDVDRRLGELLF